MSGREKEGTVLDEVVIILLREKPVLGAGNTGTLDEYTKKKKISVDKGFKTWSS